MDKLNEKFSSTSMYKLAKEMKKVEEKLEKLKKERKSKFAGEYAKRINSETDETKRKKLIEPVKKITKEINLLQNKLADLQDKEVEILDMVAGETKDQELYIEGEDVEIGHTDDEAGMLKNTVYQMAEYSLELYKMLDYLEKQYQETDFPHWWQAKLVKAREYVGAAKHYLESEIREKQH